MIYLIHFDTPYYHARHYIGFTNNITKRVEKHKRGTGSKLLRALREVNIPFHVVKTWEGDRKQERKLKNNKNALRICPVCNPTYRGKYYDNI